MTRPFLNRWARTVFPVGSPVAPLPLIFFSLALVILFQLPAHFLVRAGWLSTGIVANELIAVAGVPLLFIWLLRFDARRLLPFVRPRADAAAAVVALTLGTAILIDYCTAATERFIPEPDRIAVWYDQLMATAGAGDVLVKLLALCFIPAVCEEIYFRGFCQTSLQARWGRWPALLCTALLFAVLHGKMSYVHLYVLLGLVLGWVYAATGSLWMSILCHFLNNAWTFLTHVAGVHLPSGAAPPALDAAILAAGLLLMAAGVWSLKRQSETST